MPVLRCAAHTNARAGWRCEACGRALCVVCAARRRAGLGCDGKCG